MHVVDACHRLHLDFTARTLHDKRWREGYDALGSRVAAATAQYVPSSDLSFATALDAFEKRAQRGAISRDLPRSRRDLDAISARSRRDLGAISARSRRDLGAISARSRRDLGDICAVCVIGLGSGVPALRAAISGAHVLWVIREAR